MHHQRDQDDRHARRQRRLTAGFPLPPQALRLRPCLSRNNQSENRAVGSCSFAHFVACTRRSESKPMLNRCSRVRRSIASSSGVSKSNSNVANPALFSVRATNRFRGLFRLLPLPWTKRTSACALFGIVRFPKRSSASGLNLYFHHVLAPVRFPRHQDLRRTCK